MKPTQRPWTREEEEQLRALILSGKSKEAIAKKLNRTPTEIRTRASKLKLPLKSLIDTRRGMAQVGELIGSGKILINKAPRGTVEYRIAVYRAEDRTTFGEGYIASTKEYVMVEAENSSDVQLTLRTGLSITIIIEKTDGVSAGVRMISAPGPNVPTNT